MSEIVKTLWGASASLVLRRESARIRSRALALGSAAAYAPLFPGVANQPP